MNIGKNPQIGITNKRKYGDDWYVKLGHKGVEAYKKRQELGIAKPRGFAAMSREKVVAAGKKGGAISRRGPSESN